MKHTSGKEDKVVEGGNNCKEGGDDFIGKQDGEKDDHDKDLDVQADNRSEAVNKKEQEGKKRKAFSKEKVERAKR